MIAQMDVVHNAARMAMADHRAADPAFLARRPLRSASHSMTAWLLAVAAFAFTLLLAD